MKLEERTIRFSDYEKMIHKCLNGTEVSLVSDECLEDLKERIDDTIKTRNSSSSRSDERIVYNNLLKLLKRKLSFVEKLLLKNNVLTDDPEKSEESKDNLYIWSRITGLEEEK